MAIINVNIPIEDAVTDGSLNPVTSNAVFDALALKANEADLALVATSGDYNDLDNLPTIPPAQVNADWNATSGVAEILNKPTIPSGTVTSVGLTMPSAFTVANSPITSSGDIAVTGAGLVSQYVRGDGTLANFPASTGGGASQSFYLNGSVSQGTFGGVAFKEMDRVPILGVGTDFTINTNGYIQSFITDANDPNQLEIPAGNWNFETYFSASSNGGNPSFYVELYKWDGATLSLIASNSANPEFITGGTNTDLYVSALAVPQTTLLATDRLAIRIYVTHSGRTIKLHTENSHLCQVITTFSTGLTALNGLTAQVQNLAVGTSGTDFVINSSSPTHTFNLPTASAINRGALSSADWSAFNGKFTLPALTSGSVLFSNGSTIVQDNTNLVWDNTNKRLGIGATPSTSVRLDVRAQGALSTDIAFRVRNSADTANIVSINGIGDILLGANAVVTSGTGGNGTVIAIGENAAVNSGFNKSPIAIGKNSVSNGNAIAIGNGASNGTGQTTSANIAIGENAVNLNTTVNCISIGSSVQTGQTANTIAIGGNINFSGYSGGGNIAVGYNFNGGNFISDAYAFGRASSATTLDLANSFSIFINRTTRSFFVNQNSNLVFRTNNTLTSGTHFDASATNTFTVHNGVSPATNITDAFQQYSKDIIAGNAAPHFRTENGDVIKLYRETTAVTSSAFIVGVGTAVTDTSTFDGYTIGKITKALRNLGILA